MNLLALLSSLAVKAVKTFFVHGVASAIAHIIPKKTLVSGALLGHTVTVTTRDVGKALISRGLDHLIDRSSGLPASISEYTDYNAKVRYQGQGSSLSILQSCGMPRRIDFDIPKPRGLELPQFPPLTIQKFPELKPRRLLARRWNPKKRRWE